MAFGCHACKEDKPYTPFGVTSAVPAVPSVEPTPSASPKVERGSFRAAVVAPPGSRKLRMGALTLDAPPRYVFDRAVVLGEGESQLAVAWVTAEPDAHDVPAGQLVGFAPNGERKLVMTLPSFVPVAPGCRHATRLVQSGPASVLLDTVASCPTPLLARVPVQAVSVVSPASSRPEVLTLRVAAPAAGEALAVEADSSDRDGDGREDVRLTFTLTAPSGAKASATLAYLDRAAGVSRDAAEPRTSLLSGARSILSKAGPNASSDVDAARRLLASLCAEGATPRIFDAEGGALRCDDLGAVVDTLARAEVLSRLAAKDHLGAAAVLTRGDWYFKKLSADAEKAITKELAKRLLGVRPTAVVLGARPRAVKGPHWSPLWFEADGALLIQTDAGLVRASRDGGAEAPVAADAEATTQAWPLDVVDAGGGRLTGSLCACDSSEVQLGVSNADGSPRSGLITSIMSPRPGGCKGRFVCPDPTPISASASGFAVLLAGSLSGSQERAEMLPSPGSARSPDGKWLVAPTPIGLLVSGPAQELWKLPDLAQSARDCVVASDRAAVACVADGKVVLLSRP